MPVGSRVLQPCGTHAAYRRHKKRGEKPCATCINAARQADKKRRSVEVEPPARRKARLERNREHMRNQSPDWHRASSLHRRFRMTLDEYLAMVDAQGGCCAICEAPFEHERRAPDVDHNHTTGVIRGLLCERCNKMIGLALDRPIVLERAAAYLRRTDGTILEGGT